MFGHIAKDCKAESLLWTLRGITWNEEMQKQKQIFQICFTRYEKTFATHSSWLVIPKIVQQLGKIKDR